MAYKQKNKLFFHISVDPSRAGLLIQEAEARDLKPAALVRELVHKFLASEECSLSHLYEDAKSSDRQLWEDSYKHRFKNRATRSNPA